MNRRHFKIKGFDVDVVIEAESAAQMKAAIAHLESKGMKLEPKSECNSPEK